MFPAAWGFDKRGKGEHGARMSSWIKGIIVGGLVGVGVTALIVSARNGEDPKNGWAWIDVVSIPRSSLISPRSDLMVCRYMPSRTSR